MPLAQLLFFFMVLPIIYTMLAIILMAAIASSIKQIRQHEYAVRLIYDQQKAKIGQEASEKYKASYALAE